jgi:hypothetical protein
MTVLKNSTGKLIFKITETGGTKCFIRFIFMSFLILPAYPSTAPLQSFAGASIPAG